MSDDGTAIDCAPSRALSYRALSNLTASANGTSRENLNERCNHSESEGPLSNDGTA